MDPLVLHLCSDATFTSAVHSGRVQLAAAAAVTLLQVRLVFCCCSRFGRGVGAHAEQLSPCVGSQVPAAVRVLAERPGPCSAAPSPGTMSSDRGPPQPQRAGLLLTEQLLKPWKRGCAMFHVQTVSATGTPQLHLNLDDVPRTGSRLAEPALVNVALHKDFKHGEMWGPVSLQAPTELFALVLRGCGGVRVHRFETFNAECCAGSSSTAATNEPRQIS